MKENASSKRLKAAIAKTKIRRPQRTVAAKNHFSIPSESNEKSVLEEYVELRTFLFDMDNARITIMPQGSTGRDGKPVEWDQKTIKIFRSSLTAGFKRLTQNTQFNDGVDEIVKSIVFGKRTKDKYLPFNPLSKEAESFLQKVFEHQEWIHKEIAKIPPGIEKAKLIISALLSCDTGIDGNLDFLSLTPNPDPDLLEKYFAAWKRMLQEQLTRDSFLGSKIFWVSRDFQDANDDISHYKFWERFSPSGFDETFAQVEDRFAQSLVEGFDGTSEPEEHFKGNRDLYKQVSDLLLICRSSKLSARLQDIYKLVLERLAVHRVRGQGYWKDFDHKSKKPDMFLTCGAAICFLRLNASIDRKEWLKPTINWIQSNQNRKGYWEDTVLSKTKEGKKRHDLWCTLLGVECLLRSGTPTAAQEIQKAIGWIVAQQEPNGYWHLPGIEDGRLSTSMVLELLTKVNIIPNDLSDLDLLSRDFCYRAQALAKPSDSHSLSIAVTLAFQSVEFFLYSLLNKFSISTLKENSANTIGLESAWGKLQKHLNTAGKIKDKQDHFSDRSLVLTDLPAARDNVVHRGKIVDFGTTTKLVKASADFISHYSRLAMGHDILV